MWSSVISIVALNIVATAHAATLIDVLNQSGASEFAALIQSDPSIAALYFSTSIQTVFAPIDGSPLSKKLKRQSDPADKRKALYHGISQTNNLGDMSTGAGKSLDSNDRTAKLKGKGQVVVSNPKRTNATVANRWYTPSWSTYTKLETHTHHVNYNLSTTTVQVPPPPYSHTEATISVYTTQTLGPSPLETVILYSTIVEEPASPEATTIYSTLAPPPAETLTVIDYSTLPAPLPETSTVYSTLVQPPPPTVNLPSLLKIYSGLGNNVNIIKADIPYDGGVIHVVDGYFTLPESVSQTAITNGNTEFAKLAASTNLTSMIDNTEVITCFVPSNAAFAKPNAKDSYASSSSLLSGHIIPDFVGYLPELKNGTTFKTQSGTSVTVLVKGGDYYINNAKIIASNQIVDNGVVHVLDSVITSTAEAVIPVTAAASPLAGSWTVSMVSSFFGWGIWMLLL